MKTREAGWLTSRTAAVLFGATIAGLLIYFWNRTPSRQPLEIANALLEMQQTWQTNRPHPAVLTVPGKLRDPSFRKTNAGLYGARVEYRHTFFGIAWWQYYEIRRYRTNLTEWTLYELRWVEKPIIPHPVFRSERRLITITNVEPCG